MNRYYVTRRDGTVLAMDAVVRLSEKFTARPTAHPVASAETISDTIIQDLPKFQLEGIVSGIAQPHRNSVIFIGEVTQDIIDTITQGEVVRLQSADRAYDTCVLTDVSFSKTSREGTNAWEVSMSLSKILVTRALTFSIEDPQAFTPEQQAEIDKVKDQIKELSRQYDTTTTRLDQERETRLVTDPRVDWDKGF